MLYITSKKKLRMLFSIFDKCNIKYSLIGKVNNSKKLLVKRNGSLVAEMPAKVIANAPLLDRLSKKPYYLENINKPPIPMDLQSVIISMISNPNICNKKWIYEQFDYEVGLRTVLKPGFADSSVL